MRDSSHLSPQLRPLGGAVGDPVVVTPEGVAIALWKAAIPSKTADGQLTWCLQTRIGTVQWHDVL